MQDLVAAYWMWFVVALLVGGAVGYWLLRRLGPQPTSAVDTTREARVGNAPPEAVALAERTRAAVKSAQDETAGSAGTIEDARLAVEAKAAEVTRIAASAKAVEEARLAVEVKAAEEARIAAVAKATEDARLAVDAKAAEVTRIAGAARAAEAARVATAATAAKVTRTAVSAKPAEEARVAAEAKAAEEARITAAAKVAEDARLAAAAKAAEEARIIAASAKVAEEARLAAEPKTAKKARTAAAAKVDAEAHLVAKARITAAAREAAAMMANAPGVAAVATGAEAGISHPGSKPAGIAVPAEGGVDDLKLIKGIGPKNEKACNALGIYQFHQIADWTPDEAVWVGHHMAFPGRIEREHWIAQARLLASGGETEHARAVKSGSLVVDESADEPLDQAATELLIQSLPAQAATVEGEDKHVGRRPYGLASAVGAPDDLKKIRGIGPQNERRLHALGIWHFSQIATWSEDNVKWVGSYLAFAGRIDREKWVAQARDLAAGKDTELSRRVAAGKVATSKDDGAKG